MQAVIITVYRNLPQVKRLAQLLARQFLIYIHVDKKNPQTEIDSSGIKDIENVHVYSLFHINWGG